MVEVTDALKEAFLNHSEKSILLTFSDNTTLDGSNVMLESMEIEQSICQEDMLRFGSCGSSSFKIKIRNGLKSYKGLDVTVQITAHDFEGNDYPFTLGTYTIEDDAVSDDRRTRSLTAYDKLYYVFKNDYFDWYTSLHLSTNPLTLKQFRDSFFNHIGITQENVTLINDDYVVTQTINANTLTGQTILEAICELNCTFGSIGYDGKFRYIEFAKSYGIYPRNDLYPDDYLYPDDTMISLSAADANYLLGTFVYKDYYCHKIDSVRIIEDDSDDGTVVGTGNNQYTISGNFLLFGSNNTERTLIGTNFLESCKNFFYTPATVEMWGRPWLQVGDLIQLVGNTTAIIFPILHRTLTGITALKDKYEAQGKETYEPASNTLSSQFEKYKSRTMKMERNVDEFYQEFTEYEETTDGELESLSSRISQTASSISFSLQKNGEDTAVLSMTYTKEDGSVITLAAQQIQFSGLVEFTDLSTSGSTIINGDNITTGTINCNLLNGGVISGQTVSSITGDMNNITVYESLKVQRTPGATRAFYVYSEEPSSGTFVDYIICNAIWNTFLTMSPSKGLQWKSSPDDVFYSYISSNGHDLFIHSSGNQSATISNSVYLQTEGYTIRFLEFDSTRTYSPVFRPEQDDSIRLGDNTHRWQVVYATNGTIQTSDRKKKTVVESLIDDDKLEDFIMKLEPVMYTSKEGDTGRCHMGLIAQDVAKTSKETLGDLSVYQASGKNGEYYSEDIPDEDLIWALNYTEFIAPMMAMIQKQQKKIEDLEERIKILEEGK